MKTKLILSRFFIDYWYELFKYTQSIRKSRLQEMRTVKHVLTETYSYRMRVTYARTPGRTLLPSSTIWCNTVSRIVTNFIFVIVFICTISRRRENRTIPIIILGVKSENKQRLLITLVYRFMKWPEACCMRGCGP